MRSDRGRDLGLIIHLRQFIQSRAMLVSVALDIAGQTTYALPFVVACILVVHIAECPLNQVSR